MVDQEYANNVKRLGIPAREEDEQKTDAQLFARLKELEEEEEEENWPVSSLSGLPLPHVYAPPTPAPIDEPGAMERLIAENKAVEDAKRRSLAELDLEMITEKETEYAMKMTKLRYNQEEIQLAYAEDVSRLPGAAQEEDEEHFSMCSTGELSEVEEEGDGSEKE